MPALLDQGKVMLKRPVKLYAELALGSIGGAVSRIAVARLGSGGDTAQFAVATTLGRSPLFGAPQTHVVFLGRSSRRRRGTIGGLPCWSRTCCRGHSLGWSNQPLHLTAPAPAHAVAVARWYRERACRR